MKSTKSFARIAATLLCLALFASASFAKSNPLNIPLGLAVDAKGNLWVANQGEQNILAFSPTYKQLTADTITQGLSYPNGVAFDTLGDLWVSNYFYPGNPASYISEYTNGVQNRAATISDGVVQPTALAIDGLNNIWVVNANNGTPNIVVYAATTVYNEPTTLVRTITPIPPVNGITVTGDVLAFGSNSNTYVTPATPALISGTVDTTFYPGYTVAALTTAGGVQYAADTNGAVYTLVNTIANFLFEAPFVPAGLAVDSVRGRIYVSNGFNAIFVYNMGGELLHTIN
ncbi:MAG: hypothetical protein ABSD53_03055 [Terriglobales bacterium]|jgi:hypothetical protein